jgi:hypothetical protein
MKSKSKKQEETPSKQKNTRLVKQDKSESNKTGTVDNTVHAKEEKESMKNSK